MDAFLSLTQEGLSISLWFSWGSTLQGCRTLNDPWLSQAFPLQMQLQDHGFAWSSRHKSCTQDPKSLWCCSQLYLWEQTGPAASWARPNCTSGNKRGQLLLELDPLIVPGRSPGTSGSIDELCTLLVPLSYFSVPLVPLSSFRWHWFQSDTCLWCHWPQPDTDTSTGLRLLILLSPGSSLSFLFLGDLPSWLFSFSNYQPWRRTPVPWWVPRGQELRVSLLCLGLDSLKPLSDALLYTGFLRFCRALAPLPFRGYFASAGLPATGCQRGATRSWLPKAEPPARGLGAGLTAA